MLLLQAETTDARLLVNAISADVVVHITSPDYRVSFLDLEDSGLPHQTGTPQASRQAPRWPASL